MKTKFLFFSVCTVLFIFQSFAQSADEDALKKVIRAETEAYYKKDSVTWKALHVQDNKVTNTYISTSGFSHNQGWTSYEMPIMAMMKKYPEPAPVLDLKEDNYVIRINGNMAYAEYEQVATVPDSVSPAPFVSHELRTLVKENGNWKIASVTVIDTSINSTSPAAIEDKLNSLGYVLISQQKIKDAIEVFKTNVKLFPNSWNVYDSLGEAYADDGDKADAIANYEKSVSINAKNESGVKVLAKLKAK